jgi:hypothetical protein
VTSIGRGPGKKYLTLLHGQFLQKEAKKAKDRTGPVQLLSVARVASWPQYFRMTAGNTLSGLSLSLLPSVEFQTKEYRFDLIQSYRKMRLNSDRW